jgi:RNA polymerase sigma-19 factor, ECF subfamily
LRLKGSHTSDEMLDAFRNGDEKAFNFFFRKYYAALCYFSFQILKNKNEAEEIAGDSIMKLWERHANFMSTVAIKSFLYKTVRNASLNSIREQKRKAAATKGFNYINDSTEIDVSEKMIEAEVYKEVFLAIENLPPKCKQIFKMLLFEHKDHYQIASELNLSVSTIQNQKARAIMLLRQRIAFSIL